MTTNLTSTDALAGPPGVAGQGTAGRRPGAKREFNAFSGLAHIALFVWAVATAGPLIWVVLASFKSNTEIFLGQPFALPHAFSFHTYVSAWSQAHVGRYFINSVFVVALSTAGTMLFGSMAAYVLARYRFPGNRFIAYSLPFTVFFLAAFFKTLPSEIEEAAVVDGASHTRTFFQIMVPMARSGLVSITIFNIVGQWNQYLLPVAIMQGAGADSKWVLTQGIASISVQAGYHAEWSTLFAALTLSMLPMIVVYAVFQRQIQAGLTAGALK